MGNLTDIFLVTLLSHVDLIDGVTMPLPPTCKEVPMSLGENSQYTRTHQYAAGAGRPNQAIPLDTSYHREGPLQMMLFTSSAHRFSEGEFVPPGFFEHVSPRLFELPASAPDWKYSMRRAAQEILPFIYLGPWACIKDRYWLESEGFTLLLAVRDRRLALARLVSGEKAASEMGVESDTVDISNNQELISNLPRAIRRINDHVFAYSRMNPARPPKIFLFCETGNGLSAIVLIAYLMVMFNAELPQAIQAVQTHRFCIETDEEARIMLRSFESILEAKRDVEQTRRAVSASPHSLFAPRSVSRKRDMDYRHEDENMGDNMDTGGIGGEPFRRPLGPFQDRQN